MEFDKDVGRLQRLMAASIAGVSRRQAILETLFIDSGDRIIDVGCGAGQLLGRLAKAVGEHGEVIGLDPSADQLAQAKSSCSDFSKITSLNPEPTPHPSAQFDPYPTNTPIVTGSASTRREPQSLNLEP